VVKKFGGWSSLLLSAVATVAVAGGCGKADQTRSAFETHSTELGQKVAALRSRTSDLESRFRMLPPQSGDTAIAAQIQRRRIQASIIGTRQTLVDIQAHLADSGREVEAAIRRGDAEGEGALSGVIARMNEYVRQQEQTLAANEDALTRIGGDVRP
jgi:hypothetical protein